MSELVWTLAGAGTGVLLVGAYLLGWRHGEETGRLETAQRLLSNERIADAERRFNPIDPSRWIEGSKE